MTRRLKYFALFLFLAPTYVLAQEASAVKLYRVTLPNVNVIPYQENDSGQTQYHITYNGTLREYQTYAHSQGADKPRAAILLLHGAGRTGVSLVEKWKDIADQHNVILIGPTSTNNWGVEDGPLFLDAVLKDVSTHYNIDPKRLYLFGHSRGAMLALYVSVLRSRTFAATAVHAGMFYNPSDYRYVASAQRKIPIAFFNGTNDESFPLDKVKASAEAFASNGHDTSLFILEDQTHWYYDAAPFINAKAWDFLSQYQLD